MGKIRKNGLFYPSDEEGRIIRECAARSAGRRGVRLEPGYRCNVEDHTRPTSLNICLVSDDPNWDDTDLSDYADWYAFRYRGVEPAPGGRLLVDFYVYSLGENGELETNVQAYFEDAQLQWVSGTGDGRMWEKTK